MTGPKILVADIERVPGVFRGRYRNLDVSGEFWSLSDYKHLFGRIKADDVVSYPRTICAAWRVIGGKKIEFAAEWESGGAAGLHRRLFDAVDGADVLVGHNVAGFDIKHLRTGWIEHDLGEPSPFKLVDTLSVARQKLGAESKTLDALTKRFGIPSKTDHYSIAMAKAAVAGDKKAQRKIRDYNRGDIEASEALFLKLQHLANLPHASLYGGSDEDACRCGSTDLRKEGFAYTALGRYQQYACKSCGRWLRGKKALQVASVR